MILERYRRKIYPTDLELDLEFKSRLTIICGESAAGKTFICSLLKEEEFLKDSAIFLDYSTNLEVLDYILLSGKVKQKLIVIDNADILINNSKYKQAIRKNKYNQYIIMMYNYAGLPDGPQSIARIHQDNNNMVLRYTFMR